MPDYCYPQPVDCPTTACSQKEDATTSAFLPCSLFLISLKFVFLFFDNLRCTGAVMNGSNSFARQQACLSPCPMPEVKSFYFQAFPHQFRMSSVSYSSLFFPQYDVRDAECYFRVSLLKEGFSWRINLIHAPS
jgi:hypothetical protein